MSSNNALLDNNFLYDLTTAQEREIYCKIIALNFEEYPLEEITGNIQSGSISLDGASAVRRSCSISLIAQELDINSYYWGLNTKIKVMIGMKNTLNDAYNDIIWFPQGIYILTSFSTSQSTSGWNVSLSGKDKMCLLNGEVGGVVNALSWDFGTVDIEDTDKDGNGLGTYSKQDYLLKDIITEAVHLYAKEPYHNIIINDLDDVGLELLEYRGTDPMFLLVNQELNEITNYSFNAQQNGYFILDEHNTFILSPYTLGTIPTYDDRIVLDFGERPTPTIIYSQIQGRYVPFTVIKVEYGDVVGYKITDLTFAGSLIVSAGTSITNGVLDPICKMLGDFEYFYNVDGQFLFQKKKTYVNTVWNNLKRNEESDTYAENSMQTSRSIYTFENGNLITSFSNNPDLANVKNDYSIWGKRVGASGVELPIHLRYAIDKKPHQYTTYEGITYVTDENPLEYVKKKNQEKIDKVLAEAAKYKKTLNPNGLPEEWWEIQDWANYYELLTGHYPIGTIGQYADGGHGGGPNIQLGRYFDIANSGDYSNYSKNQTFHLYIFDVDYGINDENSETIGYTGHGCGCSHPYDYFLQRANNGIGTSYIYKPVIPSLELEEALNKEVSEFTTEVALKRYRYNCDWRELLYQMARDNSLYGHNEDFLATIGKNNQEEYPSGITGYEQYYVDLYSFWRDLYNPDFTLVQIQKMDPQLPYQIKNMYQSLVDEKKLYTMDIFNQYVLVTPDMQYNENLQYFIPSLIDNAMDLRDDMVVYQQNDKGTYDTLTKDDILDVYVPTVENHDQVFYKLEGDNQFAEYVIYFQSECMVNNEQICTPRTDINFFYHNKITQSVYFDLDTVYYDEDFLPIAVEEDKDLFFNINSDYYIKEGFKNVSHFDYGHTYYTKTGNVIDGYNYIYDFSIDQNKTYYLRSGERVTSFTPGNSYYLDGGKTFAFTILDKTYYEDKGFTKIYQKGTFPSGYYYQLDDDNHVSSYTFNKFKVGVVNYGYFLYKLDDLTKDERNEIPVYLHQEDGFYLHTLLKKTDFTKTYYTRTNFGDYVPMKHLSFKPIDTELANGIKLTQNYYLDNKYSAINGGWTLEMENPEQLNFWFDFLDTEGDLSQYAIPNIGDRPKAENDDNVKAIYYREVPNVIFVDNDKDLALQKAQKPGYTFVRLTKDLSQLFSISTRKKSAKDKLDEVLYENSYCAEAITLSCLPVYHLQPNTRIMVHDDRSGINGEYIISKITIPLNYNGTMSINATKAVERIY